MNLGRDADWKEGIIVGTGEDKNNQSIYFVKALQSHQGHIYSSERYCSCSALISNCCDPCIYYFDFIHGGSNSDLDFLIRYKRLPFEPFRHPLK